MWGALLGVRYTFCCEVSRNIGVYAVIPVIFGKTKGDLRIVDVGSSSGCSIYVLL